MGKITRADRKKDNPNYPFPPKKVTGRHTNIPKASNDPNKVSQLQLAKILGYTIKTINAWRATHDDFPGPDSVTFLYDVKKVQQWKEDHPDIGQVGQKITGTRETLMCENLEKRNQLLDRQIAEADLTHVPIERIMAGLLAERVHNVQSFRKRMLSELPAELDGKPAREIAVSLEGAFNEFLKDVQDSIPAIIKATHV